MDIHNHQTTVGTPIRQYTYVGDSNKRFMLQYRSDATRSIADYSGFTKNGGLGNRTVTLQRIGTTTSNSTWLPLIQAAVNSWNNSGSGINIITTTGASNHTIRVDNFPQHWDGLATKDPIGNVVATTSKIEINTSRNLRASNNPEFNPPGNPNRLPQLRQAVIAHEIGHLFWLGDNPGPPSGTRSLMQYNHVTASTNWVFTPQTYDRNNVRWLYNQAHHH